MARTDRRRREGTDGAPEQVTLAQVTTVGDLVQLVGEVRWFFVERLARELGVQLDPATFHPFEGEVALAAESVTVNGVRR